MSQPLRFSGVMPANLLPFKADLSIDEAAYRRHLRWLADTRGVTGIVANGHAAEVASLSRDERKRAAYGFHLPFGEGSHRWSVRQEAYAAYVKSEFEKWSRLLKEMGIQGDTP